MSALTVHISDPLIWQGVVQEPNLTTKVARTFLAGLFFGPRWLSGQEKRTKVQFSFVLKALSCDR